MDRAEVIARLALKDGLVRESHARDMLQWFAAASAEGHTLPAPEDWLVQAGYLDAGTAPVLPDQMARSAMQCTSCEWTGPGRKVTVRGLILYCPDCGQPTIDLLRPAPMGSMPGGPAPAAPTGGGGGDASGTRQYTMPPAMGGRVNSRRSTSDDEITLAGPVQSSHVPSGRMPAADASHSSRHPSSRVPGVQSSHPSLHSHAGGQPVPGQPPSSRRQQMPRPPSSRHPQQSAVSSGRMPAARPNPTGQMPVARQHPTGQMPVAGQHPTGQMPVASQHPTGQMPVAGGHPPADPNQSFFSPPQQMPPGSPQHPPGDPNQSFFAPPGHPPPQQPGHYPGNAPTGMNHPPPTQQPPPGYYPGQATGLNHPPPQQQPAPGYYPGTGPTGMNHPPPQGYYPGTGPTGIYQPPPMGAQWGGMPPGMQQPMPQPGMAPPGMQQPGMPGQMMPLQQIPLPQQFDIANLPPGTNLGDWVIERKAGQGAMGVVYRARDVHLDRPVAIKFLAADLMANPAHVERFRQEARVLAQLEHPNILGIYRLGTASDRPYIVMQWMDGQSMSEWMQRYPPSKTLLMEANLLLQAATGMAVAHAKGIIHRDVKPANLMITKDLVVKVADFGLARFVNRNTTTRRIAVHDGRRMPTLTGGFVGTPAFASPEQLEGRDTDARSDIYSLGITAYQLVVGQLPYRFTSMVDVVYHQVHTPLPSARDSNPTVPRDLDNLLLDMCEKNPHERVQSMSDVVVRLEAMLEGLQGGPRGSSRRRSAASSSGRRSAVPFYEDVESDEHDADDLAEDAEDETVPLYPAASRDFDATGVFMAASSSESADILTPPDAVPADDADDSDVTEKAESERTVRRVERVTPAARPPAANAPAAAPAPGKPTPAGEPAAAPSPAGAPATGARPADGGDATGSKPDTAGAPADAKKPTGTGATRALSTAGASKSGSGAATLLWLLIAAALIAVGLYQAGVIRF